MIVIETRIMDQNPRLDFETMDIDIWAAFRLENTDADL